MMTQRFLLQLCVAIGGLIPVGAGLSGALFGPAFVASAMDVTAASHFRYLSGLLLGIGLAYWTTIPGIEHKTPRFQLLTAIVFVGGLARLYGFIVDGAPDAPMLGGLAMELAVTPLLCFWQTKFAHSFVASAAADELLVLRR
jgi:hypothetical protein